MLVKEATWKNQNKWFIITQDLNYTKLARIYDDEQRETINRLIGQGYVPTMTTAGKGRCTKRHWNLEEYSGKNGSGYRMISSYRGSLALNSITYFIKS